jgi:hypothetical protein
MVSGGSIEVPAATWASDSSGFDRLLLMRCGQVVTHHLADEQVTDVFRVACDRADDDVAVGHNPDWKMPAGPILDDDQSPDMRCAHAHGGVADGLHSPLRSGSMFAAM